MALFPTKRVDKISHSLEDLTVDIAVIKRRANGPVANISMSFHDDYIKENAKFRNDTGLKSYIVRTTDGSCCEWCSKIAGRYDYASAPEDVFRRHDNCGCHTYYENGRTRQDVWTKKSWEVPEIEDKEYKPTRFTHEQAKELERQNLLYKGIDKSGESGIIKTGANSGAYTSANDPDGKKRNKSAKDFYEQIRKRNRTYEIAAVSKNTGFSEDEIDKIFAHIFELKHLFENGEIKRFEPDYYMQNSWMRLREGKNIQPHDITLLKHELAEAEIMGQGTDVIYEIAHREVERKYNYSKELLEYLKTHDA